MADLFDLQRFLDAQESTFEQARAELAAGQKRSHWMWFIFPQIRGLGSSALAQRFAIGSLKEAEAYLEHPLLGSRLRDCTSVVNSIEGKPISKIFAYSDDLKFHSSMTLFATASSRFGAESRVFSEAIRRYFAGRMDSATVHLLNP